jgi:hypothetical protein
VAGPRGRCRTELGLESPRYSKSCPFVFIRGSKPHPAFHPQPQPSLHEFVVIRVHSWFKTTPSEAPSRPISGWKAHTTASRAHSCPFVVQNDPPRSPLRTDLGLESPSCIHSCPFVVQNDPPRSPFRTDLGLEPRAAFIRVHSCPFVSIRVHSWFKTTPRISPTATALAARIRGYSCPFVVQNAPLAKPLHDRSQAGMPTHSKSCPFVVQNHTPAFHP